MRCFYNAVLLPCCLSLPFILLTSNQNRAQASVDGNHTNSSSEPSPPFSSSSLGRPLRHRGLLFPVLVLCISTELLLPVLVLRTTAGCSSPSTSALPVGSSSPCLLSAPLADSCSLRSSANIFFLPSVLRVAGRPPRCALPLSPPRVVVGHARSVVTPKEVAASSSRSPWSMVEKTKMRPWESPKRCDFWDPDSYLNYLWEKSGFDSKCGGGQFISWSKTSPSYFAYQPLEAIRSVSHSQPQLSYFHPTSMFGLN